MQRESLWSMMKSYGIQGKIITAVRAICVGFGYYIIEENWNIIVAQDKDRVAWNSNQTPHKCSLTSIDHCVDWNSNMWCRGFTFSLT